MRKAPLFRTGASSTETPAAMLPHTQQSGPARSIPAFLSRRAVGATHRYGWLILGCTILGMLLEIADQMIVSTAMPRIVADLSGFNQYAWVTTAYLLGATITMPLYGKLADIYEAKWVFLFGLSLFIAASALCGAAHDMTQLILLRALQGIGGGALPPVGMVILSAFVTPRRRAAMQGSASVIVLVATVAGPIVGGGISDLGPHTWRWVFYINVPLGLAAAVILALLLPRLRVRHDRVKIDYVGALLLALATAPLLLMLKLPAHDRAFLGHSGVAPLLAVALLVLALFILHELRHPEPIFDPRLLTSPLYAVTTGANTLLSATTFASLIYIPLYVQGVFGHSAFRGGLVLTPLMLSGISGRIAVQWLRRHHGHIQTLTLSCLAINVAGAVILALLGPSSWGAQVILAMLVLGAGLGASSALLFVAAVSSFSTRQFGQATGTLFFLRSLGGAITVAVLGSVLTSRFASAMMADLPSRRYPLLWHSKYAPTLLDPRLLLTRLGRLTPGYHPILHAMRLALAASLHDIFMIVLGLTVVCFAALALVPVKITRQQEDEATALAERGMAGAGELMLADPEDGDSLEPRRVSAAWDVVWHILYWRHRTIQAGERPGPAFNTFDDVAPRGSAPREPVLAAAFDSAWARLRTRTPLDRHRAEAIVSLLWGTRDLEGDIAVCGGTSDQSLAGLLALVVETLRLPKIVYFYHGSGDDRAPDDNSGATSPADSHARREQAPSTLHVLRGRPDELRRAMPPERRCCFLFISGDDYAGVKAWLGLVAPLAMPGAVIGIGHYHSGRPGARRATQEYLRDGDARLYAGPLPLVYFFAGAADAAGMAVVDWSDLRANAAYRDFLYWVKAQVTACYKDTATSARDRNIVAALEKMALPERADLYLGRMIDTIYGDPPPVTEYSLVSAGVAPSGSPQWRGGS